MIYPMYKKIAEGFAAFTSDVLNLVYPLRCLVCDEPLEAADEYRLCKRCVDEIRPNPKPWCPRCGRSVWRVDLLCPECRRTRYNFERTYSGYLYDGVLKECIHLFKYEGAQVLSRVLSVLMVRFIRSNPQIIDGIDAVLPVPLHRKRLRQREYNQSAMLASSVSKEFKLPFLDAVVKQRSTLPQNALNKEQRRHNVQGAFVARQGQAAAGRTILIVDDVFTTGSTIDECSRALLDAGAYRVRAVTLARGI